MLGFMRNLFHPARRRLETRLQLAMAAGNMAAWEQNVRTGALWWSEEMFALHGLAPGSGVPQDYYALVHPDDRGRLRQQERAAAHEAGARRGQYRVVWPDGSVHWIEGIGRLLEDEGGQPELVVGMCLNIDARKEEENNLQFLAQASAELAALTDYSATMQRIAQLAVPHFADWCAVDMLVGEDRLERVAVAHVDAEKVRLAHELHERYPPDPDAPNGTWNVIRSGCPERVAVISAEMLEASARDAEHLQAIRALGLHSYMGVPLVSHGQVRGAISFITSDSRRVFTERDLAHASDLAARAAVAIRNAELMDALRQSDAAKDVFLATLAHELRNPLAPIVNTLALLDRSSEPVAVLPKALEVLQRQTTHLRRLVDDLLDLARINSGKIDLQRDVLELRDVLRTAVEACQPLVDQRGHALVMELPGEAVAVEGDAVRLTQVFSNLLNNAAKYTPPGGRIELRIAAQQAQVQVCVSDNGNGIPLELQHRMFELFAQAPATAGSGQHGLGIGLYLVRRLVQMHGGTIRVDSGGAGTGSRFTVTLPRVALPAASMQAAPAAAAGAQKKVLVVDDNRDAAETLAQLLDVLGHACASAHDGTSALHMVEQFQPDVVLLDIGLPDIDGYEVARRIRANGAARQARLVALTGWGQPEDKRRAEAAGFDAHWTKPVDPAKLGQI